MLALHSSKAQWCYTRICCEERTGCRSGEGGGAAEQLMRDAFYRENGDERDSCPPPLIPGLSRVSSFGLCLRCERRAEPISSGSGTACKDRRRLCKQSIVSLCGLRRRRRDVRKSRYSAWTGVSLDRRMLRPARCSRATSSSSSLGRMCTPTEYLPWSFQSAICARVWLENEQDLEARVSGTEEAADLTRLT